MPKVTVVDTSCLILFHKINELDLLQKLYNQVYITGTVAAEFKNPIPDWLKIKNPESGLHKGLSSFLDTGEATSIALASEIEDSLLIIDETKGRKTARELGIRITGSLGVLAAAKKKGHIRAVKPKLDKIKQTNFRISEELVLRILEKVNEAP